MTMFVQQQNVTPSNLVAFNFLLIAFLTGIASAFQTPTLSLYLSQEIQVSPFFVGLFYSVNAIIGIILSQILAKYSDKQDDRRKVMIVCCLIAVLGCLIFAYSRNYYVLIIIGTTLLGLGSSANPQSFALAREYAESSHREAVMFTTIMRTQISLAWIVGPPLSFFIALNWGFDYMYLVAGSAFLLCAGVSKLLPKIPRQSAVKNQEILDNTPPRKSVIYLFIANLLLWTCNSMYLINMPLFVINELHLGKELAGTLMGTAAGLEIPMMILAGYLTKYLSKKRLMMIALVSGLAFYSSLLFSDQTWQLIGLQMLNAIFIGIILSQILAKYSDKQDDRRKVMIVCCLIAVLGCLIFAYSRNYYVLIIIGTTLLGLGSSANPQSFALAREYAESSHREAVMFTTIMRTQISLAWIVGPPLSFFIALNWGFDYMYLVAGSAFLLCAGVSKLLPKIPRQSAVKNQEVLDNTPPRKSVIYLFIANLLLWTCNSMYLINMPLFVINELHLDKELAGTLMGTAAGLEIPVMILAGYLTKYFSKKRLMMIALVSGLAFYSSLLFAEQTWHLIGLQMLNAIFIGITATIGMVYFQDLMPTKMGTATTLFSNAAKSSWIIGGPIAGIIAEIWHYNSVFYVAVALIFISVACMWKVKSV